MLTREEALGKLRDRLPHLRREYGVKRLGIFGSVALDAQTERSDIDILAEFERPIGLKFVELTEDLERILGSKADVLTPAGVSSIRNRQIAKQIEESLIYVSPV